MEVTDAQGLPEMPVDILDRFSATHRVPHVEMRHFPFDHPHETMPVMRVRDFPRPKR